MAPKATQVSPVSVIMIVSPPVAISDSVALGVTVPVMAALAPTTAGRDICRFFERNCGNDISSRYSWCKGTGTDNYIGAWLIGILHKIRVGESGSRRNGEIGRALLVILWTISSGYWCIVH